VEEQLKLQSADRSSASSVVVTVGDYTGQFRGLYTKAELPGYPVN
jgi:hypothetical protein